MDAEMNGISEAKGWKIRKYADEKDDRKHGSSV